MHSAKSYIWVIFWRLKKHGRVPQNVPLVKANVVELYPSLPHQKGFEPLSIKMDQQEDKIIPTEDLLKMA